LLKYACLTTPVFVNSKVNYSIAFSVGTVGLFQGLPKDIEAQDRTSPTDKTPENLAPP